jgi:para-nitrobenzyl esterase
MRFILPISLLAILVASEAPAATPAPRSALIVQTESGRVAGAMEGGTESWKGIPFAAPPVGPLRWRAPQPAQHWTGVRLANAYGHDCMQQPFGGDAAPLGTPPAEDCLYLNIWKPAGKPKLPVVLWIYGGGFVNGGSSPPTYSGANLASQGIMFVSFNYRVGRFGTFAHPVLTNANEDNGLLGNYGYLDQIAALKWVRRNIAAFGGDPSNITIVGESAGGVSVHMLMTSPMAQGLFRRAVIMSGGDGDGLGGSTVADGEPVGAAFAEGKGVPGDDPQALAKLRALSAEQVTDGLNLAQLFGPGARTFSSPFWDGRIAVNFKSAYDTRRYNHVPVMIGATSADIGGNTGMMIGGARTLSRLFAGQGLPVYSYRFSYVAESIGSPGAQHASDIPFFFHTEGIKYADKTTARDSAMGKAISAYVVNFAKTGDPNGAGLPKWPRYRGTDDVIMDFGANGSPSAVKDPLGAAK